MKRATKYIQEFEKLMFDLVKLLSFMLVSVCIVLLEYWSVIKLWGIIFPDT